MSEKYTLPETVTCEKCKGQVSGKDMAENMYICPLCGKYNKLPARQRIASVTDAGSFKEFWSGASTDDPLRFPGYGEKLDKSKKATAYKVNFADGELYENEKYVGNIFLNGAKSKNNATEGTTYGAPLKAVKRSYVFMLRSSDKGATWSKPVDITGDILNQNRDGFFLGIAPGNAVTTKSGRLVFPLYTLKGSVCIYSDDNGNTWRRNKAVPFTPNIDEWTLAEGPDGNLYSFSRAKGYKTTPAAISYDNGISWAKTKNAKFKAPKCQKNCFIDGEKVYVSHPSKEGRNDGVISTGTFEYDKKGKCKGIKWSKEDIKINEGFFAYSCMTKIDNNTIGILYEDQPSSHIVFETIKL